MLKDTIKDIARLMEQTEVMLKSSNEGYEKKIYKSFKKELKQIKKGHTYNESKYVIDAVSKGWVNPVEYATLDKVPYSKELLAASPTPMNASAKKIVSSISKSTAKQDMKDLKVAEKSNNKSLVITPKKVEVPSTLNKKSEAMAKDKKIAKSTDKKAKKVKKVKTVAPRPVVKSAPIKPDHRLSADEVKEIEAEIFSANFERYLRENPQKANRISNKIELATKKSSLIPASIDKAPTPVKKTVAKKAPAKKVVAKKTPVKKTPAKKVVAKKAPVKKTTAKK